MKRTHITLKLGSFLALLCITFPVELQFLSNHFIIKNLEPFRELIIQTLEWNISPVIHKTDSTEMLFHMLMVLIISTSATIFIASKIPNNSIIKLNLLLRKGLLYYLSLVLFKYGIIKVLQLQFYAPEPNVAYTPFGQLDKDILFWSTMGTSGFYSIAIGLVEILTAIMMWFKKIRFFAIMISIFSCGYILITDIAFEITVICFASLLFCISVYLGFPSIIKVYKLLHNKYTSETIIKRPQIFKVLKPLVIILIVLESYPTVKDGRYVQSIKEKPIYGPYKVIAINGSFEKVSQFPDTSLERLHLHNRNYIIFQNTEDQFTNYQIAFGQHNDILLNNNQTLHFHYGSDTLELEVGVNQLIAIKIKYAELPVFN
jgi:hypothetical protein